MTQFDSIEHGSDQATGPNGPNHEPFAPPSVGAPLPPPVVGAYVTDFTSPLGEPGTPSPAPSTGTDATASTPKVRLWKPTLLGGLAGAVIAAAVSVGVVTALDDDPAPAPAASAPLVSPSSPSLAGEELDIRALLDKVSPSVVSIIIGQGGRDAGAGSGVIITADGLVLTNAHVVDGAETITVRQADGKKFEADLVGSAPANDIALVQVRNGSGFTAAVLGDTSSLQVGDEVVAIGNALNLGDTPSVTRGIISAKNRSIETDTGLLQDLLQTDAAISRGNSGGPLLNSRGEVVGINSAGIPSGENIGFAIDINAVKPLIEELKSGGGQVRGVPFLGVATVPVEELDQAAKDELGVDVPSGLVVSEVVAATGAAAAGVQTGDVIVGIDGAEVTGRDDLRRAIIGKQPGDEVTLTVVRDGKEQTITATLGSRAATQG